MNHLDLINHAFRALEPNPLRTARSTSRADDPQQLAVANSRRAEKGLSADVGTADVGDLSTDRAGQ